MLSMLLVVVSAAPTVGVVERSTLGLAAAQGMDARERLVKSLVEAQLTAELLRGTCLERECLLARAAERKGCVVGVTLVKNKKGLTVDLEAVHAGAVVLQQTFLVLSEKGLEKAAEVQVFAYQLASKLVPREVPVNEPVAVERPLAPEVDLPVVIETRGPSPAKVGLGLGAGVVGAAGVALLVVGLVVKGTLDAQLAQQPVVTTLTRPEAQAQADLANGLMVGGAVSLAVAAGLATGAVLAP